jgi:hypothetical protein
VVSRAACLVIAGIVIAGLSNSIAAEMFAYPEKGQSEEQQQADRQYCETWATRQTGSIGSPSAQSSPSRERMGGGMMRGRMIGEAAGNSGAGMMGGGMAGLMRRRIKKKREEEQQQSAQNGGPTDAHDHAFKACMEGRGYTVE